jgi:hypothetical protein
MRGRLRSMKAHPPHSHTLTPAQRGQIVQRVIVDGWSPAAAANAARLPERLVAAWVTDFRRNGMASLRNKPGRTVAAEIRQLRLLSSLRVLFRRMTGGLRWLFLPTALDPPSPIRHSHDDLRGSS